MFFCVQAIEYTLANESFFTAYWTKNYPAYVLSIITQTANIDPTVVEEWYHFAEHKTIFSCSLPAIIMVSISRTALKYPEHINKLVIMNVPHPKIMNTNLLTNPKQMQKSWYVFFFQLPDAPEKLGEANNYEWPIGVLAKTSRPGAFTLEDLEKYRAAFAQPGAYSAMVNWYRASLQVRNNPPDSFRITMPTLVLWGAQDVAIIPEQAEQSMAYCDQGRLVMFNETTHWIQHEAAERINPMIEEFFHEPD
jgi:pimeloyl-ACP methyl ester carboxylesterase